MNVLDILLLGLDHAQVFIHGYAVNLGKALAYVDIRLGLQVEYEMTDIGNRLDLLRHRLPVLKSQFVQFAVGHILQ